MSTSTKVAKQYLKHNNIKYFRSKAENVQLGSYGRKKDAVGAMAYLSVHDRVDPKNMVGRARFLGRTTIDWDSTSSSEWESSGAVTYLTVNGRGSATAGLRSARRAHLELIKLGMDAGDLQQMLNRAAGKARRYLRDEGNDARFVSEIYVVVEAEIAESFASAVASGGEVVAKLTKALSLEFEADHRHSSGGSVSVIPSRGTTFAYGMHKVARWDGDRITRLEDDRKGMG